MQVIILNQPVQVQIIRKPNKNLYMRFANAHVLQVSCNNFISEKEILKAIEKNKKALEKMYQKALKENDENLYFWYLGRRYEYEFSDKCNKVEFTNDKIIAKDNKMLEKFWKDECLRVFTNEVNRIVPYFSNIPAFKLKIRYMKTRWGVNNLTGHTITLNSELLKKDISLVDYVIIHELCHFYEANHSSRFWEHVEEYYPKYKEARKKLRS